MNSFRKDPILIYAFNEKNIEKILLYAWILSEATGRKIITLPKSSADIQKHASFEKANSHEALPGKIRAFVSRQRPGMLIGDWPETLDEEQEILSFAVDFNIPSITLKNARAGLPEKIIVPTAGGFHALPQLWLAVETAKKFDIPVEMLRVTPTSPESVELESEKIRRINFVNYTDNLLKTQAELLGLPDHIKVVQAENMAQGIKTVSKGGDLIIMGGPDHWRASRHFSDSISALTACSIKQELLMLLSKKSVKTPLRNILWEKTIKTGIPSRKKEDIIAGLVETLAESNQIPPSMKNYIIRKALQRERILSTSIGSETAIPHVTLPDFIGISGCMGICPEGVNFGSSTGKSGPVKFIFLLITDNGNYSEYLTVLSEISRLMVLPALRQDLLKCRDASEVMNVLDLDNQ